MEAECQLLQYLSLAEYHLPDNRFTGPEEHHISYQSRLALHEVIIYVVKYQLQNTVSLKT